MSSHDVTNVLPWPRPGAKTGPLTKLFLLARLARVRRAVSGDLVRSVRRQESSHASATRPGSCATSTTKLECRMKTCFRGRNLLRQELAWGIRKGLRTRKAPPSKSRTRPQDLRRPRTRGGRRPPDAGKQIQSTPQFTPSQVPPRRRKLDARDEVPVQVPQI